MLCSERSSLMQRGPHRPPLSPATTWGGSMLCSERSCLMLGRPHVPQLRPNTPKYISNSERKKRRTCKRNAVGLGRPVPPNLTAAPGSSGQTAAPRVGVPFPRRRLGGRVGTEPLGAGQRVRPLCLSPYSRMRAYDAAHTCYGLRPPKHPLSAQFRGEEVVTGFCYIRWAVLLEVGMFFHWALCGHFPL